MQVLLKRNWFTPFGRYKKSATKKGPPVEIPESLRKRLPSDAVIVDDYDSYTVGKESDDGTMSMREAAAAEGMDVARVSAEAEAKVHEGVDGNVRKSTVEQVRANAVKFQKELDAENAEQPLLPTSKAGKKKAEMQAEVDAFNAKKGK